VFVVEVVEVVVEEDFVVAVGVGFVVAVAVVVAVVEVSSVAVTWLLFCADLPM
jgi:hypothetical protein